MQPAPTNTQLLCVRILTQPDAYGSRIFLCKSSYDSLPNSHNTYKYVKLAHGIYLADCLMVTPNNLTANQFTCNQQVRLYEGITLSYPINILPYVLSNNDIAPQLTLSMPPSDDKTTVSHNDIVTALRHHYGEFVNSGQMLPLYIGGKLVTIQSLSATIITDAILDNCVIHGLPDTRIMRHDVDFATLGVGGLGSEFDEMFRRVFAGRTLSKSIAGKINYKPIKGILLYGPPGCGKTMIARAIGRVLNCREPKIVNGPEVLDRYVGGSEAKVRALFADAEADQDANGDNSDLHLIIFDEFDAIAKVRGSTSGDTGVHDSIVNTILTKLDGVKPLNNIVVIAMTNRRELIDSALLRPGRFEVQLEIGLPDLAGRREILTIHLAKPRANHLIDDNVNIDNIATQLENYTGAEIAAVVQSAISYAINRVTHITDGKVTQTNTEPHITLDDITLAISEVKPRYGRADYSIYYGYPYIANLFDITGVIDATATFMKSQQISGATSASGCRTIMITGMERTGKTCTALHMAQQSNAIMMRLVSSMDFIGLNSYARCDLLRNIFMDAWRSPTACIILDNIERLIDWCDIGAKYNNDVLQTLLTLLNHPNSNTMLIIATCLPVIVDNFMPQFDETVRLDNLTDTQCAKLGAYYPDGSPFVGTVKQWFNYRKTK